MLVACQLSFVDVAGKEVSEKQATARRGKDSGYTTVLRATGYDVYFGLMHANVFSTGRPLIIRYVADPT